MIFSYSNRCSLFRSPLVIACLVALTWFDESRFASAQETTQVSSNEDEIARREYLRYALMNDGDIERGKSLYNN